MRLIMPDLTLLYLTLLIMALAPSILYPKWSGGGKRLGLDWVKADTKK